MDHFIFNQLCCQSVHSRMAGQFTGFVRTGTIDEMLKQPNCPFVLFVGTKKLVKRKAFEAYIDGKVAI